MRGRQRGRGKGGGPGRGQGGWRWNLASNSRLGDKGGRGGRCEMFAAVGVEMRGIVRGMRPGTVVP